MARYLLDTNILREVYLPAPSEKVASWYKRQNPENLYISTLNVAEIIFGIEQLPAGKKRTSIETWIRDYLYPGFDARILSFDLKAAQIWGSVAALQKIAGRPRPYMDSLLAAIALAHDMTLVTRNTKDFSGFGLELVNPF